MYRIRIVFLAEYFALQPFCNDRQWATRSLRVGWGMMGYSLDTCVNDFHNRCLVRGTHRKPVFAPADEIYAGLALGTRRRSRPLHRCVTAFGLRHVLVLPMESYSFVKARSTRGGAPCYFSVL